MGNLQFDTATLPAHATLIAREDVWIEGDAVAQFARVAALPGCVRAVAMPDLHPGRGIPVGAAFAFENVVHPALIGGDAGCGVRVAVTNVRAGSLDALERRVRLAVDEDPLAGVDAEQLLAAVWHRGPRGLAELDGVDAALARLAEREPDEGLLPSGELQPYAELAGGTIGTVGGGNHFMEIAKVGEVRAPMRAEALGLSRDAIVVVAHSGSRGLGGMLARRWGNPVLDGVERDRYLGELAGACRFARANRFVLAFKLLRALGAARESKLSGGFDLIHNHVREEPLDGRNVWVHRKGAAPAAAGQPTVVLGSRGAPSWVFDGQGDHALLASVAHGAGRRMGRSEARAKIKARYQRTELTRTALGGRVVCSDPDLLYEEHPDAYKPIAPIVEVIAAAGLAAPLAALHPIVTVKQ